VLLVEMPTIKCIDWHGLLLRRKQMKAGSGLLACLLKILTLITMELDECSFQISRRDYLML